VSTIYDVAKRAGVSTATVSRAFNSPGLISHETHRHIMEIAKSLDYKPLRLRPRAPSANLLSRNATTFVGFHFFSGGDGDLLQANDFYGNVLAGALVEASSKCVQLVLTMSRRDAPDAVVIPSLGGQALQAAILVGSADPVRIEQIAAQVRHVVLADGRAKDDRWDSVLVENVSGASAATRYLIDRGHTRIAFLLGHDGDASFQERLDGFLTAHYRRGLPVCAALIIRGSSYSEAPIDRLRACFAGPDPPTAIVTANDHYAYSVYHLCHELGLTIPADLSVVGFDDNPYSRQTCPPLTTVRVNTMEVGRMAVRRILDRINAAGVEDEPGVRIVLPVSLVERESTGRPSEQRATVQKDT
jgi:DNA-binding LacI/PurR family transcriptional regulator